MNKEVIARVAVVAAIPWLRAHHAAHANGSDAVIDQVHDVVDHAREQLAEVVQRCDLKLSDAECVAGMIVGLAVMAGIVAEFSTTHDLDMDDPLVNELVARLSLSAGSIVEGLAEKLGVVIAGVPLQPGDPRSGRIEIIRPNEN